MAHVGRPTKEEAILKTLTPPVTIISNSPEDPLIIPNLSGVQNFAKKGAVSGLSASKVVVTDASASMISGTNTNAEIAGAVTHAADNTQAHSDYLLNSGTDEAVGPLTITADNSSADTAYVPMVLYNTDATPPAANTVPIGTIYVQYTA